mmetsp:Transcript_12390/g.17781  ORF Transcript_12390/g.17781 Transcript_12390/m.17781 type:complete len:132 (-) Transcript_12390:819-1214(-)
MALSTMQSLFAILCLASIVQVTSSQSPACEAELLVNQFFTMETVVNATSDYTCSKIEQEDLGKLIQYESLVAALKMKDKLQELNSWNARNSTVCEDPKRRQLSTNTTTMIDPDSRLRRKLYGIGGFVYRDK